jgi:hypothetical protein
MIARIWQGRVPVSKSQAPLDLMCTIALPEYHSTPEIVAPGACPAQKPTSQFEMLSFWEYTAAIQRFAGNDYSRPLRLRLRLPHRTGALCPPLSDPAADFLYPPVDRR